ncbi:MAG: PAS domain S-box protein [Candidatus Desulfofervidaceae bacterium]|nr:PAS domain S-box protein [Candidatus Desulfofervidaceae bacterium]
MSKEEVLKVALVGGGPGGLAVLKMFESEIFTQLRARVVGVADINPQAPGIVYARDKGIFTTTDYKELYQISDLYLIIELTGINEVLYEIARTKPLYVQLMDHVTARLFWDIFQIEEQRIKAEETLRYTNELWENIFNCIQDFILVIDKNYSVINVNQAVLDKTGLSKEEVKKKKCYELARKLFFYKPCDVYEYPCPLEEAFRTGKPISRLYTIEKPEESETYIEITIYPLKVNATTELAVEIQRDITDFVVCSAALEESEKKFYSIFETARDAIIILDEHLKIHLANKAVEKIFGYSKEELVQISILELVPQNQTEFYRFLKNISPSGEDILIIGIKKGGQRFPLRASLSSFTFKGKRFFTVIMRDQTHHQQMQEKLLQAEKMAAIGQTASYLMHEIKNPLLVIGGFAQQLLKQAEGRTKERLEIILEEVKRLEKLLNDVRDFTKPIPLEKHLFNINELILKTLSLFKTEAQKHEVKINVNLDQNLPKIEADAELIKQVLINVIKNAIEVMPDGGKINVVSEKENGYVRIEIEDTGPGIPPEKLKEIFNPFFTTKRKGTGLGLTISYRIIKDHGGDIKIESTVGRGTKCIILLPL